MKVLTGIDIVEIADFKKSLRNGGQTFLNKIFLPSEQKNSNPIHLAGIFAAKEAVIKALSLGAGKWLKVKIKNYDDGRPQVILPVRFTKNLKNHDLSISHTETTAVAVFMAVA